jgi:futalosine hydrolase
MPQRLLILSATQQEQALIRSAVRDHQGLTLGHRSAIEGTLCGRSARVIETGMGAVNTAQALTAALESSRPTIVLQVGIGGAYTRSGLQVGDLAIASEEAYGDLGVVTPDGWQDADVIGIPVLRSGDDFYNRFPVDAELSVSAEQALLDADWPDGKPEIRRGPFVTVQRCSGTKSVGDELADRFGAICESMEGAAAAHICKLYGVRFLEIRGISNQVVDRDLSAWAIPQAAERSQQAVLAFLGNANIWKSDRM